MLNKLAIIHDFTERIASGEIRLSWLDGPDVTLQGKNMVEIDLKTEDKGHKRSYGEISCHCFSSNAFDA